MSDEEELEAEVAGLTEQLKAMERERDDWNQCYEQLNAKYQRPRPHLWKVSFEWKWENSAHDSKPNASCAYFSTVTDDIPTLRKEISASLGNQYRLSALISAEYLGRIRNINDHE